MTDGLIEELTRLTQLKTVHFDECQGMTDERYRKLKSALSDAVIETFDLHDDE